MLNAVNTLPAAIKPSTGILAKGKSLVSFYKNGITNIWHNFKLCKQLRRKLGVSNGKELAHYITENAHLLSIESVHTQKSQAHDKLNFNRKEMVPILDRCDFLTLLRTERDIRKLPVFAGVFAVCFEFTPVILWACPQLAPSTCFTPGIIDKFRKRYTEKRLILGRLGCGLNGSESVFRLQKDQLHMLSKTLGLFSDKLPQFLIPVKMMQSRVQEHLTIVRADDYFLRRAGDDMNKLETEELHRALAARCLPLDGGLSALKHWLDVFNEPMDAGYFAVAGTKGL